jgi:hypothetical protein
MSIKEALSSKSFEQISWSFLLYSIALLLLSTVPITIDGLDQKTIEILSSVSTENIVEPTKDISIEEVKFSEDVSILKDSTQSALSIPEIQNKLVVANELVLEEYNQDLESLSLNIDNINETINSGFDKSTEQSSSVSGVLDRLTPELVSLAEKKPLNTIWLFDASISLSKQRDQIKDRIVKILDEIEETNSGKPISHTVCSFGKVLIPISKQPHNLAKDIVSDIESIKLDDSGIENIFGSIVRVCDLYKDYRNTIIVFTDEVGDDIGELEKAINSTQRKSTPVYVVGPPAPFGLSSIEFKYVDPDPKYDQKERWVQINQGPETLFKMTLDLHTLPIDEAGLDSGYGPYGLTRLCYSSGGIYFSVHPNRSSNIITKKQVQPLSSNISRFFDPVVMTKYRPDYRNYLAQHYEVEKDKTKIALIKACQIPLKIASDQKTNFTAFNEGDFADQLKDAQIFSAKIEPKIDQIYNLLKPVESFVTKLDSRWIASYNLAMGRILATKCRIELYNHMLAEAKSGLKKQDKKSNSWNLERTDEFSTKNSQLNKYHDGAVEYLQSVVTNYPGTPWAAIAQEELDTPMGYKWIEKYVEPPKAGMGNGGNNNNVPKDDRAKTLEIKPQRKIDKI